MQAAISKLDSTPAPDPMQVVRLETENQKLKTELAKTIVTNAMESAIDQSEIEL